MFDPEFYPTPKDVIRKMLQPFNGPDLRKMSILEPSAGSGAILDCISDMTTTYNGREKMKLYCCEQNAELAEILKGKGYRLAATDFLAYKPLNAFNLIIMNPPFSNGVDHVLHAWDILDSGHLVALVNAETVRNAFSGKRKLLAEIIGQYGTVEYLGSAFANADRATNVDVALIRLKKAEQASRFSFDGMKVEAKTENDEDLFQNQIARQDVIGNLVLAVDAAKKSIATLVKSMHELDFYSKCVGGMYSRTIFDVLQSNDPQSVQYNNLVDDLNNRAWHSVLSRSKFENVLTGKMREDFSKFSQSQGSMAFTKENVDALFDMLMTNKGGIMKQAIEAVFETMCSYDKANKIHWEGWKTNSAYKVNRKVIVPRLWSNWGYSIEWDRRQFLDDVDKAMCWLDGQVFDAKDPDTILNTIGKIGHDGKFGQFGEKLESRFFYLRYFKKGTLHFEWKDAKLWERFNLTAAEGKAWLPAKS